MKVKYAGTWLAAGGIEGATGVTLNGSQVVQVQQLFRATAVRPVARGNKSDVFSFSVRLSKNSVREAERALLAALANLPASGQLEVTCGHTGDEDTFYLAAVLQSVTRTVTGSSPAFTYTFVGGLFTDSGSNIISEEGDMLRNKIELTTNDTTKAVTFYAAQGAAPTTVQCWIVPPDDGAFIDCRPLKSSIATTGFTAVFGAAIPASGYELHWTAVR